VAGVFLVVRFEGVRLAAPLVAVEILAGHPGPIAEVPDAGALRRSPGNLQIFPWPRLLGRSKGALAIDFPCVISQFFPRSGNRFPERFLDGKLADASTKDGARHEPKAL
jgi:hypothetical protein